MAVPKLLPLLALIALLALARPAAAAEFLEGTEDVPLMTGLVPVGGSGLSFDSPQGRIVIIYAEGTPSADAVLSFYAATLKQLGWAALDRGSWQREGERLKIETGRRADRTTVRFTLSPTG